MTMAGAPDVYISAAFHPKSILYISGYLEQLVPSGELISDGNIWTP